MKICADRGCPNKALRNSPRCMEHVKLAAGAGFPMRRYQEEMLRQMATMRAMMESLDEQRYADNKRDRERVWGKPNAIVFHQAALRPESYNSRDWFWPDRHSRMPKKNVRSANGGQDIRKAWK